MQPNRKVILVIMDGWGLGTVPLSDAIQQARTPFVSSLYHQYPHSTLVTCGEAVGLPGGQMGNSEVGHLNLGAGRIVYQELQRINVAIRTGELAQNATLQQSIGYALQNNKPLHLLGLVSDGGVHSHLTHIKALLDICKAAGLQEVFVHAFTDGRDTDPKSGLYFITELEAHMRQSVGKIATVNGRYYAMDRDNRWERIKLAYDAMVSGVGHKNTSATAAITDAYNQNVTDEFILPIVITSADGTPLATLQNGDAALCFNFRTDRCREITKALTQMPFPEQGMHPLQLHFTTITEYDATFENVHVIFETDNLNNTLGQVIEQQGLTQMRVAETEKVPTRNVLFSGGREAPFAGETRFMAPSPKVATYDLQPEMSAAALTAAVVEAVQTHAPHFICLNYANADMVGHTGVFEAVVKAVETVDDGVRQVVTAALENNYTVFLTADHGNADYMINPDGSPNTAHTLNLVPYFIIEQGGQGRLVPGKLGDVAPTILHLMGLPIPKEMTGEILVM